MTITEQVRDHFRAHPGLHFDNAMLRVALDIDEAQQISVALNALHNAGELKREKKEGHGFDYWVPASHNGASPAPISPKDLVARLAGDRAAKASKPEKKAKRGRPAKALTEARPGVDAGGGTHFSGEEVSLSARFAISNAGEIGIRNGVGSVSLERADVKRLWEFMTTVAQLWK